MRARVDDSMRQQAFAEEAAAIVRTCVHCGFCNATCPTYQISGDELEGPRGRIYLIKALLESGEAGASTRQHLDQCLVCRNCETTCPSGVSYGRLVELARPYVKRMQPAALPVRLKAWLLTRVALKRPLFAALVACGRPFRRLLPPQLREHLPPAVAAGDWPTARHARRVLVLGGCVQPVLRPSIDAAAARIADRIGISLMVAPASGCCGALPAHLGYTDDGLARARANIDAWWPAIEAGAEAVLASSSACGLQLREYAHWLAGDPAYAERAQRLARLVRDPLELFDAASLLPYLPDDRGAPLAVHAPCTLQHGQRRGGMLEGMFGDLGYPLTTVAEANLCCGSAGSYSLFHPEQSHVLRQRKLGHLMQGQPRLVVTANIGCQMHLDAAAPVPVVHWLEFVDAEMARAERSGAAA